MFLKQLSIDATVVPNVDEIMDCIEEGSLPSTSRIKTSDANRLFLEKYRALDLAGQVEQTFPSLSDASIVKEYRSWNQKSVAAVTCLLALLLVDLPYGITRFNLAYIGAGEHPFTISSQVAAIPTFNLFGIYIAVHLYIVVEDRHRRPHSWLDRIHRHRHRHRHRHCRHSPRVAWQPFLPAVVVAAALRYLPAPLPRPSLLSYILHS
jgi:hypothetical protein